MAGSQQQQIIDTIFSMKRRLMRPADLSDSDETDPAFGPQKQSLKRKVQYSRSGDIGSSAESRPYKKRIEHAGYQRYILQRNPPRYDQDGDLIENGDEYEDEDDLSPVEEDPYADIQLENLLAPLTSAAQLPTHPGYSVAYTSKHLTDLTNEAAAISRKENITLAHAKAIFNKLQGDSTFVADALAPMAQETFHDFWHHGPGARAVNGLSEKTLSAAGETVPPEASASENLEMIDAPLVNGVPEENGPNGTNTPGGPEAAVNGTTHEADGEGAHTNGHHPLSPGGDDASDAGSQQTAHRMTTRARAHAASTPSPPLSPSSMVNPVHPLFTFSTDAIPDRDFGLPASEAEETRMLLMAYVQKQEEIARVAKDLYYGMMQGERMRQEVFKMAKAEAHLGEMSDGEDWYDREEWDLDEDLGKGKDEEDDDAVVTGKKSTRQRRKPDKEDR